MSRLIYPVMLDGNTKVGIDLAAQEVFRSGYRPWLLIFWKIIDPYLSPGNEKGEKAVSLTLQNCLIAMLEAELGRKKFSYTFPRGTRKFYEANGEMLSCLKSMTDYFYGNGYAGHCSSALSFAGVVIEREIFPWIGQDNVDGEISTKTAIQKVKRHQNAQLRQYRNPFQSKMTKNLFDEAIKQAEGKGMFYRTRFLPFLEARRELYKACEKFKAARKDGERYKPLRQGRKKKH